MSAPEAVLYGIRAVLFSLPAAFLFMYLRLYLRPPAQADGSLRGALRDWGAAFRSDAQFRRMFLLVFYTALVLYITVAGRSYEPAPLSRVMGDWWFETEESTGAVSCRWLLNICMLMPFSFLLVLLRGREKSLPAALWLGVKAACLFSLLIECAQLLLHTGTFQVSDLCYNTLGGLAGALFARLLPKKEP